MRSLANVTDRNEIMQRLSALTPSAQRVWGSMTVEGMICHLSDAFLLALGDRTARPVKMPVPGKVMKVMALRLPAPWPRNVATVEEVRQGGGGTTPNTFEADRTRLLEALERFCASSALQQNPHPFFGAMSHADWMRWGYLHSDHHLRQFGT
jgi:hypothetical protein